MIEKSLSNEDKNCGLHSIYLILSCSYHVHGLMYLINLCYSSLLSFNVLSYPEQKDETNSLDKDYGTTHPRMSI